MIHKSNSELQEIIENRTDYREEIYSEALLEFETRRQVNNNLSKEQPVPIKSLESKEQENEEDIEDEERRKSFKEIISALFPGKNYYITPMIIYLNILIYIVMILSGVNPMEPTIDSLINWGGNLRALTLQEEQWRLLTNVFLHSGIFHVLFNMYALLFIGKEIETQTGSKRYLFAYLATGIFASLSSIFINDNIVSVGASGAIFGMYGLLISLLLFKAIELPQNTRKHFVYSIFSFVGYNIIFGLTREGIDNAAHFGGLLSGLVIGVIYFVANKYSRSFKPVYVFISITLLACVFAAPKIIPNTIGTFQTAMKEYTINEQKALWMYQEDFSYIPEDKIQYYHDRLKTEGIDLWTKNMGILDSLPELNDELEERINILRNYTSLRKQSCKLMQDLLKFNRRSDSDKLQDNNLKIEKLLAELQAMVQ